MILAGDILISEVSMWHPRGRVVGHAEICKYFLFNLMSLKQAKLLSVYKLLVCNRNV